MEDYKNVNLGAWRASTSGEINTGQLPAGASIRQVITAGGGYTQRVLKTASKAQVVTVTEGTYNITYGDDGSTIYKFPGGTSGYAKSTCSTSGFPDCGSGSARFVITPNGANSIMVTAYNGTSGTATNMYWSGYVGSATISYVVSTPPTGGGGGTIRVKPYTPETTTTQRYGYYTHIPATAEEETKTFLCQLETANQNLAFDLDVVTDENWEV